MASPSTKSSQSTAIEKAPNVVYRIHLLHIVGWRRIRRLLRHSTELEEGEGAGERSALGAPHHRTWVEPVSMSNSWMKKEQLAIEHADDATELVMDHGKVGLEAGDGGALPTAASSKGRGDREKGEEGEEEEEELARPFRALRVLDLVWCYQGPWELTCIGLGLSPRVEIKSSHECTRAWGLV